MSGPVGRARADLVVLTPTDINRGIAFPPYVSFGLLGNPGAETVTRGKPPASEERAAIEFSLAPLPGGATITAVTLSLKITAHGLNPIDTRIDGYAGNGIIQAADLTVSNPLVTFSPASAGTTQAIDIPAGFLQSLLAGGATHAGLTLRNETEETTFSF